MGVAPGRPLQVWAVSDGRAGMETQALGLAEAVGRLVPAEIVVKHVAWKGWIGRVPSALNLFPWRSLAAGSDLIGPPWPDLWIAAGRATLPLSIAMRRRSGGRTFVVQTQDPRRSARLFDLVVPPEHDGLSGPNVFPILGAPNRVTSERLAHDYALFRERLDRLPGPRAAVLVGGRSKAFDLPSERARTLAQSLEQALDAAGASLLMSFSRRTPEAAKAVLSEVLSRRPGLIWDGQGPNPYFAFLAAADWIVVTEDSVNMAAEAASTGKPVLVAPVQGHQDRNARFQAALRARGAARPFEGRLESWSYESLHETERAAEEVLRRIEVRDITVERPADTPTLPSPVQGEGKI